MTRVDAHLYFLGLTVAAAGLIAGLAGAAVTVSESGPSPRGVIIAVLYAACTAMAFISMLRARRSEPPATAALAAAWSAAYVLAGVASFGVFFLPALVLWGSSAWLESRSRHLPRSAIATAVVWGLGLGLLSIVIVATGLPR